jgi:hypothetical protein
LGRGTDERVHRARDVDVVGISTRELVYVLHPAKELSVQDMFLNIVLGGVLLLSGNVLPVDV